MKFHAPSTGIYIRIIAIIALMLGLNDASRLLGVNLGATSALDVMGMTGFVYLGIFCLARLFAAVGLWIKASWGAVLLVGANCIELALYVSGSPDVAMTTVGFAVRVLLVLAILVLVTLGIRTRRARSTD